MRIVRERGVGDKRREAVVVERGELELDEDEQRAQLGLLLGRALLEVERARVAGVGGGEQRGVESGSLAELEDRLVGAERMQQLVGGRTGMQRAAPLRGERARACVRLVGVGGEPRIVGTAVELAEIPAHAGSGRSGVGDVTARLDRRSVRRDGGYRDGAGARTHSRPVAAPARAREAGNCAPAVLSRAKKRAEGPLFPPPTRVPTDVGMAARSVRRLAAY